MNVMLSDGNLSGKARELWAQRLDWVTEDIDKRTAALTSLQKTNGKMKDAAGCVHRISGERFLGRKCLKQNHASHYLSCDRASNEWMSDLPWYHQLSRDLWREAGFSLVRIQ
jgi:hypothetical protein